MIDDRYTQEVVDSLLARAAGCDISIPCLTEYSKLCDKAQGVLDALHSLPAEAQQDQLLCALLKGAETYIAGVKHGLFSTVLFQTEYRQSRAFDEMARRVDTLARLVSGLKRCYAD